MKSKNIGKSVLSNLLKMLALFTLHIIIYGAFIFIVQLFYLLPKDFCTSTSFSNRDFKDNGMFWKPS